MEKNEKANSYLLKLHHVLKDPPTGFLQVQTGHQRYDSFFITESLRKGPSLNVKVSVYQSGMRALWIHSSLCYLDERVTLQKKGKRKSSKSPHPQVPLFER